MTICSVPHVPRTLTKNIYISTPFCLFGLVWFKQFIYIHKNVANQSHCMSIKQARLTSTIYQIYFATTGTYLYIKQHENNKNNYQKSADRERERQRERFYASNCLAECHSMAKRPDWAMKSWTALNINEFILFDVFRSPCRRVVIFSRFTRSLNMVF